MSLRNATKYDPRGLIAESYAIENITMDEARSILIDWAIKDCGDDHVVAFEALRDIYVEANPGHPMTELILQGLQPRPTRKARRRNAR